MMLGQSVVARATSLLSQLALAALLAPADFGLIGLTYGVTTIVSTMTNLGVEDVILQRQRTRHLWNGAAFWINLALATAGGLTVAVAAPFTAAVYHNNHLISLMLILAVSMPLGALSSVPGMIMRGHLRYGVFAVYGSLEIIVQTAMTVVLAWQGFGAYSFVIPTPILAVVRAVIWWRLLDTMPSIAPQLRRWRYLVKNTVAAFVSRVVITLISQGDYMVLGLLASQSALGQYYFGFRLAAQPLWMLAGNLGGVLYPALIQLKSDPVRQGNAALNASLLLSFCVMPLAMIQAAVAGPVLLGFFGDKWASSIPIIQILSIGLALDAISWIAGSLLAARGEFMVGLRYVLVQGPVFFALVTAGAVIGQALGVAWAVCLFYAATQPIFVYGVYRRFGVTPRQVIRLYVEPTCYSVAAVLAGISLAYLVVPEQEPFGRAAVILITGGGLYALLVRWRAKDVWGQIIGRFMRALHRNAPA